MFVCFSFDRNRINYYHFSSVTKCGHLHARVVPESRKPETKTSESVTRAQRRVYAVYGRPYLSERRKDATAVWTCTRSAVTLS